MLVAAIAINDSCSGGWSNCIPDGFSILKENEFATSTQLFIRIGFLFTMILMLLLVLNISQYWQDDNKIKISVVGEDGAQISVDIDVAQWHKWEGEPFEGATETGKKYCNRPDQLGICSSVKVLVDGQDLGKAINPKEPVFLGKAPVPEQAIINRCIHELEP